MTQSNRGLKIDIIRGSTIEKRKLNKNLSKRKNVRTQCSY